MVKKLQFPHLCAPLDTITLKNRTSNGELRVLLAPLDNSCISNGVKGSIFFQTFFNLCRNAFAHSGKRQQSSHPIFFINLSDIVL